MDRFWQELPAGEDTAVTDDMIYTAGIKDIGGGRREAGSKTSLVIPMDGRWYGDGGIYKSGFYP